MRYLIAVALLCVAFTAHAETKQVCWVNATQNVDGSAIPATGSGALDRTYVQYGTRNGTEFGTLQGRVSVAAPANCLDLSLVVVQEFALRAFHCNKTHTDSTTADALASGCSDFSNVALTEVLPAAPEPPADLAVQEDTVAWTIVTTEGAVVALEVGQVEPGTACDTSQSVRPFGRAETLYRVPEAEVTYLPGQTALVTFAACSGG